MTYGQRALKAFAERIEVKYVDAIRNGWVDVAVIIDMRNQDQLRQKVAARRGVEGSEIEATVGEVISGNRREVAGQLNERMPNHKAVQVLATETPPEGEFPVLILTDENQGGAGVHFFHRAKPDIPAGVLPTGILCGGCVSRVNRQFDPQPILEFELHDNLLHFVADSRFLVKARVGDWVYAACRLEAEGKATVVDMLHCGPNQRISQEDKNAFDARFQQPDDV